MKKIKKNYRKNILAVTIASVMACGSLLVGIATAADKAAGVPPDYVPGEHISGDYISQLMDNFSQTLASSMSSSTAALLHTRNLEDFTSLPDYEKLQGNAQDGLSIYQLHYKDPADAGLIQLRDSVISNSTLCATGTQSVGCSTHSSALPATANQQLAMYSIMIPGPDTLWLGGSDDNSLKAVQNALSSNTLRNNLLAAGDDDPIVDQLSSLVDQGADSDAGMEYANNNFSYNAFLSPSDASSDDSTPVSVASYNTALEQQAAGNFVSILINPVSTVSAQAQSKLSDVKSLLDSTDDDTKLTDSAKQDTIKQLLLDPGYQAVILGLRTISEEQSVAQSTLKGIAAERTNVKDADGNIIPNSSALQKQKTMATQRMTPEWHATVQGESQASVLREIAYEQAEMLNNQYQAHIDSEKTQALLATLVAQQSHVEDKLLSSKMTDFNSAVDSVTGQSSDNATGASS